MVEKDKFLALFSRVKIDDEGFDRTKFLPGSSGATELYRMLVQQTGLAG
jgi:hypothetical protein